MDDYTVFIDSIVETYPNGLTVHDMAFEFECKGLSQIESLVYAKEAFADKAERGSLKSDRLANVSAAMRIQSVLYDHDKKVRRAKILAAVGNAQVVRLSDGKWTLIVHPSTRRPGFWQLSRLDSRGPYGHMDYETFEYALYAAIGAHPKGHLYDEGDAKFSLLDTAGVRNFVDSVPQTSILERV